MYFLSLTLLHRSDSSGCSSLSLCQEQHTWDLIIIMITIVIIITITILILIIVDKPNTRGWKGFDLAAASAGFAQGEGQVVHIPGLSLLSLPDKKRPQGITHKHENCWALITFEIYLVFSYWPPCHKGVVLYFSFNCCGTWYYHTIMIVSLIADFPAVLKWK